ncbi:MAG: RIP metalloprotease RseP [Steroidobacteraceae bacterium]
MLDSVLSLLGMLAAFIVAIGLLVSVHEYGHFWVARKLGIRVLKFSIGFGKPLLKHVSKVDGVEYIIAAIPLGGYVKMLDEREGNVTAEEARYSYNRAPIWKRILTLLAGPFANLAFAVLAYWVLLMVGIPGFKPVVGDVMPESIAAKAGLKRDDLIVAVQGRTVDTQTDVMLGVIDSVTTGRVPLRVRAAQGQGAEREVVLQPGTGRRDLTEPQNMLSGLGLEFWSPRLPAVIAAVTEGGAAAKAGLRAGDEILSIGGQPVADITAVSKLIGPLVGQETVLRIKRAQSELDLPVSVLADTSQGQRVGRIGVSLDTRFAMPDSMRALQKYSPTAALGKGFSQTWNTSVLTLKMVWKMLVGEVSTKNLSGAISMVEISGAAARQGGMAFLNWLALISISLGVFNLLPIPMLDGGQIVYQLVELLKGSPVSERIQLISQQVGMAVLLILLSLTLYNDIARHLS